MLYKRLFIGEMTKIVLNDNAFNDSSLKSEYADAWDYILHIIPRILFVFLQKV